MSVEEILKKYGVYTRDLEIDLLRHFVDLRNEILQGIKNTEQQVQLDSQVKDLGTVEFNDGMD